MARIYVETTIASFYYIDPGTSAEKALHPSGSSSLSDNGESTPAAE